MPLPNNTDLASLNIAYLGEPFVHVEAKPLDTETLDVTYLGSPFVAVGPSSTVTGLNIYVKIEGVWKQANSMYVKDGGIWKVVSSISTRQNGVWRS